MIVSLLAPDGCPMTTAFICDSSAIGGIAQQSMYEVHFFRHSTLRPKRWQSTLRENEKEKGSQRFGDNEIRSCLDCACLHVDTAN